MSFEKSRPACWALPFIVALLSAFLCSQEALPTVTYEQTFPGSDPEHYIITTATDCRAKYQSDGKLNSQSEAQENFVFEFTVTPPQCAKIFELTKRAHYFEREIDSKKKNLASTGKKILSYKALGKSSSATFNYSPNADVQQLTGMFQSMGATLENGRRLDYDHRYQKLALDEDLKRMEESSGRDRGQEISAISATLQKIIDDPSLMNVVRVRAQRLLGAAEGK